MGESGMTGASASTRAKLCVACGVDCAERPRTKDTKGRYFCKPCFDDLLARKRRGERISIHDNGASGSSAPPPPLPAHDPFAALGLTDDSPLADPSLIGEITAGVPPQAVPCPTCRAALAPGAAICVNCGTDLRSGGVQKTRIAREPRSGGGDADAPWRVPMGVIAIAAGAIGVVNYGIGMIGALVLVFVAPIVGLLALVISGLFCLVPLYHLLGGVGLLRRDPAAIDRLRKTSALFLVLCVIGAIGLTIVTSATMTAPSTEASPDDIAQNAGFIFGMLLTFSIWPIFAFIFLGRGAVRRVAAGW